MREKSHDAELVHGDLSGQAALFYARYARAVDNGDEQELRALLTDGVILSRGDGSVDGVDAFLAVYRTHWGQGIGLTQHAVSNVLASRSTTGIRATAYFRAYFFDADQTRLVVGRYDDDLVDGGEGLMVAHKRNVIERIVELPAAVVA